MLIHVDVRPPDRDRRHKTDWSDAPLSPASGRFPHLIATLCIVAGWCAQPAAPRPLLRVIERIWRAATDSVAKSFWPLSWISLSVRRARATRDALVCSHSVIFSSPVSSGSPTASTSKHNDRSDE